MTSTAPSEPLTLLGRDELDLLSRTARDAFSGALDAAELGALGWLGLLTSESDGGSGRHPDALATIVEAAADGRASFDLIAPNLAARALAALPLAVDATDALSRVLGGRAGAAIIADGSLAVTSAPEPRVSGATTALLAGPIDAVVIVVARRDEPVLLVDGAHADISVTLVDHGAEHGRPQVGVHDTERPTASITVADAPASVVSDLDGDAFLELGRVLSCADTVGAFARANRTIREHLVDRVAFGAPLASFQAIQHRLVDLSLFEVAARAITVQAIRSLAGASPSATRDAALAHAYVHGQAVEVLDECLQLAGGIGFTWEHPLHHSLRRAIVNRARFGSIRDAEDAFAATEGWPA
jgi:alkylation response protein AidB-like acyl-CoA dehydrogenase